MNVLIVINNLLCGGAQKSLVSLLNFMDSESINVDLLVLNQKDMFFDNIPAWVNRLEPVKEIEAMYLPVNRILNAKTTPLTFFKFIASKLILKMKYNKEFDGVQNIWNSWKAFIPKQPKNYDLAVSYVDGFSNYYVIDKVEAARKILWVHNEYDKLSYSDLFDRKYFNSAEKIVTISDECVKSLVRNFPDMNEKFYMLPNLSSAQLVKHMAGEEKPVEYKDAENILVSVGRLTEQKGFDMAIEAAHQLKQEGVKFSWFIIGEGELESTLKEMINIYGLKDNVFLIGLRKNPYPYIKFADVFVQPSRYEGKSIVLDEAKILCKPIIVTNYPTVIDSITNQKNGIIVSFDKNELKTKIAELLNSKALTERLASELEIECRSEEEEFKAYMDLFIN